MRSSFWRAAARPISPRESCSSARAARQSRRSGMKREPLEYGDRKVYTVSAFNQGVAGWIARLPTLWIEGEVTEFRRQPAWQSVYFTLKDPEDGSTAAVTMPRAGFDALRLELADGARVHVFRSARAVGRPRGVPGEGALDQARRASAPSCSRLEQLRRKLAGEGLFAAERKRRLPVIPRRIGLVTGQRSRGEAGRDRRDPPPLPARQDSRRSHHGAGTPSRARDRRDAAGRVPGRRGRRRAHTRRWQLRRPASLQRRASGARRRRLPGTGGLGRRSRAGHAPLRPGSRCPCVDADRGRSPRRA